MTARKLVYMPLDDLEPAERNVKGHDSTLLATSISRFGLIDIPTIDERTGRLVAGHGRRDDLLARRERGEEPPDGVRVVKGVWQVPVQRGWSSADDAEAAAAGIAANQSTIAGGWDDAALAGMLAELAESERGLDGLGFDKADLDALISHVEFDARAKLQGDPDEVPEPPKVAVTQPGDLWTLGDHRLLCGDAMAEGDVKTLMDDGLVDLLVTDPPYGVAYADKNAFLNAIDGGGRIQDEIEGDHQSPEEMSILWHTVFGNARTVMAPGAAYYVTGPQGGDLLLLLLALRESGFPLRHMLIWAKQQFVIGRSNYNYQHEPIIHGWTEGAAHQFHGATGESSLWQIDKPHESKLHPTMKPVELFARAIRNSTKPGERVLDPFGGSGTVVIAAQAEGRAARTLEISPTYCDVTCTRFQRLTQILPSREGVPHDFLAE